MSDIEETKEQVTPTVVPTVTEAPNLISKEAIITYLQTLIANEELPSRVELEKIKANFYRIVNAEVEEARRIYIEENPDATEEYTVEASEEEKAFKEQMSVFRERRNMQLAEREKEEKENLSRKELIVEQIKLMVEDTDAVNKNYTKFRDLQVEWKAIGTTSKDHALWKEYQLYVERYYDLFKLNKQFQEYDFKKNLEIKTSLCEAIEKLKEEEDVVTAFHTMQKLHQTYRETGPVAKEMREALWTRFKEASTVINQRYQQHFEGKKEEEQSSLEQKTKLCETIEAIDLSKLTTFSAWNKRTSEVVALQQEWKSLGFAGRKKNQSIFERFRQACDAFFKQKNTTLKAIRASQQDVILKKKELLQQAESLKDDTDWAKTTGIFINLQKQWKESGHASGKQADLLWKQFLDACNYFFEQKKVAHANTSNKSGERRNAGGRRLPSTSDSPQTTERQKLQRSRDNLKSEIQTYENNMGFLTAHSKKGSKLVEDLEKKVEKLKADLAKVLEQIKQLDAPKPKAEAATDAETVETVTTTVEETTAETATQTEETIEIPEAKEEVKEEVAAEQPTEPNTQKTDTEEENTTE